MQEIWIDIPKYEGHYRISNTGKVVSLKTKRTKLLKMSPDKSGRFRVGLRRYEKTKYFYVHRLVYCTFNNVQIDTDLSVVHLDHDIENNALDNLQSMPLEKASLHTKPKNC